MAIASYAGRDLVFNSIPSVDVDNPSDPDLMQRRALERGQDAQKQFSSDWGIEGRISGSVFNGKS